MADRRSCRRVRRALERRAILSCTPDNIVWNCSIGRRAARRLSAVHLTKEADYDHKLVVTDSA
jgi:hypothetical protein